MLNVSLPVGAAIDVDSSNPDHRAPARGSAWSRIAASVTELVPDDARLDAYRQLVIVV